MRDEAGHFSLGGTIRMELCLLADLCSFKVATARIFFFLTL